MFNITDFPLPFRETELEPFMSAETIRLHYGRHMATYIANTNNLITGTKYANMDLHQIVMESSKDENSKILFNNAAQVYNHDFFFNCLGRGNNDFPDLIADAFGGIDKFKSEFKSAAMNVFGSGWAWVVRDNDTLKILTTKDADTPLVHGVKPILTLDVWEHAYYIDWQNRRAEYIDAFLNGLIDWKFIISNMDI